MPGLPEGYEVSADPSRLDVDLIHNYLCNQSYWARGIPRALVVRALANSIALGLYAPDGGQVGFARLVTDRATFAWLADVFVLNSQRGKGLGKGLIEVVLAHPDIAGLRRAALSTSDAHGLYAQFGFAPLSKPQNLMEKLSPNPYGASRAGP